jgi:inosine/xanthosine triphosphate pyrophosphatase family protein
MKDAKHFPGPRCKTFAQNIGNKENAQNVLHFYFEELKNIENRDAWFLAELCKATKGVQKDK